MNFNLNDRVLCYVDGAYLRGIVGDLQVMDQGIVVRVDLAQAPIMRKNELVNQLIFALNEDGSPNKDVHPRHTSITLEPDLFYLDLGTPFNDGLPVTCFTSEGALRKFYADTQFGEDLVYIVEGYRVQGKIQRVPHFVRVWIADMTFPQLVPVNRQGA